MRERGLRRVHVSPAQPYSAAVAAAVVARSRARSRSPSARRARQRSAWSSWPSAVQNGAWSRAWMSCAIANHCFGLVVVAEEGGGAGERAGDRHRCTSDCRGRDDVVGEGREAVDERAGGGVISGGRGGIEQVGHRSEPRRVVREVEAGGGFGGEAFAGFVDASELAEHERDGGAQHGDRRVVAGDVDEEVGDLVEPALVLAGWRRGCRRRRAERLGCTGGRCRARARVRWRPRPRRRVRRAAAAR